MKFTFNQQIWAGWMLCQFDDPKIAPLKKYKKASYIPVLGLWVFHNTKKS